MNRMLIVGVALAAFAGTTGCTNNDDDGGAGSGGAGGILGKLMGMLRR